VVLLAQFAVVAACTRDHDVTPGAGIRRNTPMTSDRPAASANRSIGRRLVRLSTVDPELSDNLLAITVANDLDLVFFRRRAHVE
jgi:hypothetical protein